MSSLVRPLKIAGSFIKPFLILAVVLLATVQAYGFNLDLNKIFDIGKSTFKAFSDFTAEEQYYVGRSVGARLLANNRLNEKEALQDYVNSVGQTLALASSRPEAFSGYHFIVLDEPEKVNAYAVPGGFILITTGLINKAENEDELAGIMAHEVAHEVFYHPSNSIKKSYRDKLKKDILSFASDQIGSPDDQQLAGLVEGLNELSGMLIDHAAKGYSRKKEKEADLEAVDIMINAGYNPAALASVLKKLNAIGSGKSGTHGNPTKRAQDVLTKVRTSKGVPGTAEPRVARFRKVMETPSSRSGSPAGNVKPGFPAVQSHASGG